MAAIAAIAVLSTVSAHGAITVAPDNAVQFDGVEPLRHLRPGARPERQPAHGRDLVHAHRHRGGTRTGTGGIASAMPLVTKGRAEAETPANLNMDYFLGIDPQAAIWSATSRTPSTAATIRSPARTDHQQRLAPRRRDLRRRRTWRLYLDGSSTDASWAAFTPESTCIQHAALGTP